MLFPEDLVVVRGGGDLGTGAVFRLHQSGFPVLVLEIAQPLAIRRAVVVAAAVDEGAVTIEGMTAERAGSVESALKAARSGSVAVLVSSELPRQLGPRRVVVDARLAKRALDTSKDDAPLVVGLGPGFVAGHDCHAVVETARGPHLGRVLWDGQAAPDTGVPGMVGGESALRVIRAESPGTVSWKAEIGDRVAAGDVLGHVGDQSVRSTLDGVVRGLIAEGHLASSGLKIADVDPRGEVAACFEISDKALAVGGGVLAAVLAHLNRSQ